MRKSDRDFCRLSVLGLIARYPSGVNRLVGFLCFTETALLSMNLRVEPAFEDVTSHSDYGSGSSAQMGL
jgi:hypothetical protein